MDIEYATRVCSECEREKPLQEGFYYETRSGRYLTKCKVCVAAYIRNRRATVPGALEASREASLRSRRARKLADPTLNTWAIKTPEQKRAAYEAVKRWRARNPQTAGRDTRASMSMRRSLAYLKAWPAIVAHYGGKCVSCGSQRKVCFDHVVPTRLNGRNELANGQPLCLACNTVKGRAMPTKDYRTDGGAWIRELVRLNPWLSFIVGDKRGFEMNAEDRRQADERREASEAPLVMPCGDYEQRGGDCGQIAGGEGMGVGSLSESGSKTLTRAQKNNKRILDSLLANLPRE